METSEESNFIRSVLDNEDPDDKEIEDVISIFHRCGAVEYAKDLAKKRIEKARSMIDMISNRIDEEYISFFNDIADYVIKRDI